MLGGWVLKNIRDSLNQLRDDHRSVSTKVSHIEVLVAGEYVKRDEVDAKLDKVLGVIERTHSQQMTAIERLHQRLDTKADK
jgi:hypothetical protein